MTEKQIIEQIAGPFGLDRRDSAIVKRVPGLLYELENFLIHNGNIEVREGISRQFPTALEAGYRILALHRYYGLTATDDELKEFYAVVDGKTDGTTPYPSIQKYDPDTPAWDSLRMPPGIELTGGIQGNFEQFKDRLYYTNQKEPVLMIKKQDNQIYEAGIPEADQYTMLCDCETLDVADSHNDLIGVDGAGKWYFYTDGDTDKVNYYLDGGFERHTEGNTGLTLEIADGGKTLTTIFRFDETKNLGWFYTVTPESTVTTTNLAGVRLTDTNASFNSSHLGLYVHNKTDDSTAIITQIVSTTTILTTVLKGGTDNTYTENDEYRIGSKSSEFDYLAIDIFRFTSIDIDQLVVQFSSQPPNSDGDFICGYSATVYTDSDFENWSLHQKTLMANWVINTYSNALFFARFRKRWFIPVYRTAYTGSAGNTLVIESPGGFTDDLIGKTIYNNTDGSSGTVTAVASATSITAALSGGFDNSWTPDDEFEIIDDWSEQNYMKVHLKNNLQAATIGEGNARITIDNVRLLKTPPLPSELSLQVATCDAIERWYILNVPGGVPIGCVANDLWHSTQGTSCKKIPNGTVCRYDWTGYRDLSVYNEGTEVNGGDMLVFDVGASSTTLTSSIRTWITFVDIEGNRARGVFEVEKNISNLQQRSMYMQHFKYLDDDAIHTFDWSNVDYLEVYNLGIDSILYMDNLRIQPAVASKVINRFIPLDLVIFDTVARGVEHYFGENSVADTIVDFLFHTYANFTRQTAGEGTMVFPEYQHGRYALNDELSLPSLQLQVQSGGTFSVTFVQENDLTQYQDFAFHMDGFWNGVQKDATQQGAWWGADWVEIPASEEDEFTCWVSTPAKSDIHQIIFRFYTNKNSGWKTDEAGGHFHHGTGTNERILIGSATDNFYSGNLGDFTGKRIRNEATGRWGIVAWVGTRDPSDPTPDDPDEPAWNTLAAWGVRWNQNDQYTLDGYDNSGFAANARGFYFQRPEFTTSRPVPDRDNYYEYVMDISKHWGKNAEGLFKQARQVGKEFIENEDQIEGLRDQYRAMGVELFYEEKWYQGSRQPTEDEEDYGFFDPKGAMVGSPKTAFDIGNRIIFGKKKPKPRKWQNALLRWKRSDFDQKFDGQNPFASWQNIAAHEIIVRAGSKKSATVNFQDLMVTKKGAVTGTDLRYAIKLEDEFGYLGPSSEASKSITVKGSDVQLTDIYVPYDGRIKRKRIYRTDSNGEFRYLDTIDRHRSSYLDQLPEEELGPIIEEDYYRPPKSRHMRKVDNRMAYIDCIDRRGNRRSSRIHLSLPFIPHQTVDGDCFDVVPEDGQKVIWCEWYYGFLLVWKERSIYTIDPSTFAKSPRDLSVGCIAPLSVSAIPNMGFGWLSHEGVLIGDHTKIDKQTGEQIWDDIKGYTPEELSHAIGFYKDRYYYIFLGEDSGVKNTKGYALYLPTMQWTSITNWNVQCVSSWTGGTDNNELYVGSDYGYINRIFSGEEDLSDDANSTTSQIVSALRTIDFDFGSPHTDKYLEWIIFHAKNLSSDPTRKGLLTFTPYYDQNPTIALDDEQVMHSFYKKYDLCNDPGSEYATTLVGFKMVGIRRFAIKGFTLDVTDQDFRPVQQMGQY